jgi:hypothetical protein
VRLSDWLAPAAPRQDRPGGGQDGDGGGVSKRDITSLLDSISKLSSSNKDTTTSTSASGASSASASASVSSTLSTLTSKLSDLSQNFDAADTNQDGKVSIEELLKYEDSKKQSVSTSANDSTDSAQASKLQTRLQGLVMALLGDGQDRPTNGLSFSA